MPAWLFKTEPGTFSFADLERAKKSVWDGVSNSLALQHLRLIRKGDRIWIYHTGAEKRVVGLAIALSAAYPDPKRKDPKWAVVDLAAVESVPQPVALVDIKGDSRFKDFALVRISRLSVMPVSPAIEAALRELAKIRTKNG